MTNHEHSKVFCENERARVLEYKDQPGDITAPHEQRDIVMYTLSPFCRRQVSGQVQREVELEAGTVSWLSARNIAA
jgi:hypothetical protein